MQTHPMVEDIWNFFPFQYIFPTFVIWIGNLILFIPNIFLRPLWFIWNTLTFIANIIWLFATALFTN